MAARERLTHPPPHGGTDDGAEPDERGTIVQPLAGGLCGLSPGVWGQRPQFT